MKLSELLDESGIEIVDRMKSRVFQIDRNIEPEGMLLTFNSRKFFLSKPAIDMLIDQLHDFVAQATVATNAIADAIPDPPNGDFAQ